MKHYRVTTYLHRMTKAGNRQSRALRYHTLVWDGFKFVRASKDYEFFIDRKRLESRDYCLTPLDMLQNHCKHFGYDLHDTTDPKAFVCIVDQSTLEDVHILTR